MYKKNFEFGQLNAIFRESDSAWIPINEANTDFRDFLQYLSENALTIDDIEELKL